MKNFLLLTIAFFVIQIISAQESTKVANDSIYNTASIDVKPEFPGGIRVFYKFIGENFNTPISKDFPGGNIYVTFIIEKDGSLTDIKVLRDLGFGTGDEVKRVLNLSPKWTPGIQNGQQVRCSFSLPIVLKEYIHETAGVEKKPEYKGGMEAFYRFIAENYKLPNVKELIGKIFVVFVIEKDGSVEDVKIIRDLGYGTGDEAIRVLRLSPKWNPGEQDGKKVRCNFSLPISIQSR